jgi:ABC-type transporter Mla subunit MlaD
MQVGQLGSCTSPSKATAATRTEHLEVQPGIIGHPRTTHLHESMSSVVSASVQGGLDTANADLQLLTTNLAKSRQISLRAGLLLSAFDNRLSGLEKTVSSIHADTRPVQRVHGNLQAILAAVDGLLSHSDSLDKEERAIAKGPRMNNLEGYKDAIARLIDSFEQTKRTAGHRDSDALLKRLNNAIENGAQQLAQVLLGWVREASPPDLARMASIPRPLLEQILSISEFIYVMPESSSGAIAAQRELQRSYADVRGSAVASCIAAMGKSVLKQCQTQPEQATGIDGIVDAVFSSAKVRNAALDPHMADPLCRPNSPSPHRYSPPQPSPPSSGTSAPSPSAPLPTSANRSTPSPSAPSRPSPSLPSALLPCLKCARHSSRSRSGIGRDGRRTSLAI